MEEHKGSGKPKSVSKPKSEVNEPEAAKTEAAPGVWAFDGGPEKGGIRVELNREARTLSLAGSFPHRVGVGNHTVHLGRFARDLGLTGADIDAALAETEAQ